MTAGPDWWTRDLPVEAVATALGAELRRAALAPCPACKRDRRGSEDRRRPPVGLNRNGRGWECHACKAHGDALDFVALVLTGAASFREAIRGPHAGELRAWLSDRGWAEPEPRPELRRPAPVVRLPPVVNLPPDVPEARPVGEDVLAELADLWNRAPRLGTMGADAARAWLDSRRTVRPLDWQRVAALDLVRGLPAAPLPRWARFSGRPWSDGWRALVRTWGPSGELAGLRARWTSIEPAPTNGKAAAPALGLGSSTGRIMADPLGVALLTRGPEARPGDVLNTDDPPWSGEVWIAEGEPSFLALATDPDRLDGDGRTLAAFGVVAGAWIPDFAARIPRSARVFVATDGRSGTELDLDGERYAARISETLARAGLPASHIIRVRPGNPEVQHGK